MLNVTAQKSASAAKAYFTKSDYYCEGQQEIVGEWGGKGAVLLGLFGRVDKRQFDQLCDNLNPQSGGQLTALNRSGRRTGYDFTWSAPKSTSIVHALTGDDRIMQAFRDSVRETMAEMESEMETRVRKGGNSHDRSTGNWVYSEFIHLTSRPVGGIPCPQLHAHCFVQNATYDAIEGQWKAGQFGNIKANGFYWQAVQQARFANRLQELGYSIQKTKHAFEIVGVPQPAIEKFSDRTKLIEQKAAELGITDPKAKAKLGATTREKKNDAVPYADLVDLWATRLTTDERNALSDLPRRDAPLSYDDERHVRFAVHHLFERKSVVDERRLLTLALRHGCGEVTPEGVRAEVNRAGLLKREQDDKSWVTTKEALRLERGLIDFAVAGKGAMQPLFTGKTKPHLHPGGVKLSSEQQAVVDHLLTSPDRVMLVRGFAGTGKSTLMQSAIPAMASTGKPVALLTPTTPTVNDLRKEGFEADTLARFLLDTKMQDAARDGIIVLDEAGMVGSKSMATLFYSTDRINARIVLMGDKRQLASVESGSPLRMLEDIAGLRVAEVTDIRRQKGEYRDAVKLLARGEAGAGLSKLDALGWVKLMPTWDGYKPVAKEYVDTLKRGETAMICCPTHAEGQKIADEVRSRLRAEGRLAAEERVFTRLVPEQWTAAEREDVSQYRGDEVAQFVRNSGPFKAGQRVGAPALISSCSPLRGEHFATYRPADIALSIGDSVRITAKGKDRDGRRLDNGSIYTIKAFTKSGDIELSNGSVLKKDFGHLSHAYVSTAFAAQGRTVDRVFLVQSAESVPASSRESFYVCASRARKSCHIWTDDKRELREAVARTDPRLSATELAAKPKPQLWRRTRRAMERLQQSAMIAATTAAQQFRDAVKQKEAAYAR